MKKKIWLVTALLLALLLLACACNANNGSGGANDQDSNQNAGNNACTVHNYESTWTSDDTHHYHQCQNQGCTVVSDKSEHVFSEWIVDKEATCETNGSRHKICTTCGFAINETILAAHNYSNSLSSDDTHHYYKCQNSGCTSVKDKIAHNFGTWTVDKAPTCTSMGTRHHTCTACNKTVSEAYDDPNVHNYSNTLSFDDTHHYYKCQNSGCTSVKDKTAHNFGTWTVDEAPTCMSMGTRYHTCTACNKTVSETYNDPNAHNYSSTLSFDDTHHYYECQNSGCTSVKDKAEHRGTWVVDKAATCHASGSKHWECSVCGKTITEEIPATASIVNGNCTGCGASLYTRDEKYIYFGEYPQKLKASDVSITSTTDSRGYYLGSDGCYYAKVTADPNFSNYTFSTGASIVDGTAYYFKVEPIRWKILSESNGTALILCDSIIANHCYDKNTNNYEKSEIRAWLNEKFYNTAFSALQRELIRTTTVDNSASTTGNKSNSDWMNNPYACASTSDKIFLLSYEEVTNTAYLKYDSARSMQTSDYSRATGAWMGTNRAYYGNGYWWLRSPNFNNSDYARAVLYDGYVDDDFYVDFTYVGVVPALQIRLS